MPYKNLIWLGSSRKDLKEFPKEVQRHAGYALFRAQCGRTHQDAKLMKGFEAHVWEITSRHFSGTFRTAYYTKINEEVYVLHVFQKNQNTESRRLKMKLTLLNNDLTQYYEH